eukprot:5987702-Alexandrium_andersonii.AAC.1
MCEFVRPSHCAKGGCRCLGRSCPLLGEGPKQLLAKRGILGHLRIVARQIDVVAPTTGSVKWA